MGMKYRFEFDFSVEYAIGDIDVQLGLSRERAEGLTELNELFASGAEDLDCGDITVDEDFSEEPELYENEDGHFDLIAEFSASFVTETEGADYEECYGKAQKAFENADFGAYKFVELGDLNSKRLA